MLGTESSTANSGIRKSAADERATAALIPTRSVLGTCLGPWPSASISRSLALNITEVCSCASRPISVSRRPVAVRSNSVTSRARSRARICSLTVGWVTPMCAAAAATLPSLAATWK